MSVVIGLWEKVSPIELWRQWDGWWYLRIATQGYAWRYHGHSALAFFPLFPLLVHILVASQVPVVIAGLLVSNVAFLGALFYLHALARERIGDAGAERVVWIFALFPMCFFTFAPYTESLFLLATCAVFYHARAGHTARVGLWIGVAVATRSTAITLLAPALMLLWTGRRPRQMVVSALAIIGPMALAIALYVTYLHVHHMQYASALRAQLSWHRSLTWPWTGFVQSAIWPLEHPSALWPSFVETVFACAVTVLFLGLCRLAWRFFSPSERLYVVGFWLLILCTPEWRDDYFAPFSSVDRFVLALFPLAFWAAQRLPETRIRAVLHLQAGGLALASAAFLARVWIG